jgi:hypothetical protein
MRRISSIAMVALIIVACSPSGRCLDSGGRWNAEVEACEFNSEPLDTPPRAIDAAKRTLEFAYGPGVLDQEPFVAELDGQVWHVHGTVSDRVRGGTAHVWIDLDTGRVVRILHGE